MPSKMPVLLISVGAARDEELPGFPFTGYDMKFICRYKRN